MDASGNITQRGFGNETDLFNPNKRDSTKASNKVVPKGVWAWTVDRRFGDITKMPLDTMPHLYQNTIYNTGIYGEYNSIGNNYTARQNRIFIDRKKFSEFFFIDPYDYTTKEPDQFLYLNTLSPYTNISYDNCGDKQNGEDHIDAKFGVKTWTTIMREDITKTKRTHTSAPRCTRLMWATVTNCISWGQPIIVRPLRTVVSPMIITSPIRNWKPPNILRRKFPLCSRKTGTATTHSTYSCHTAITSASTVR